MEFLKDYDFELLCHPRNENMVVDALSIKKVQVVGLMVNELKLMEKFRDLNLGGGSTRRSY